MIFSCPKKLKKLNERQNEWRYLLLDDRVNENCYVYNVTDLFFLRILKEGGEEGNLCSVLLSVALLSMQSIVQ